ncbi:MAG: bacterioferritin [Sulfuricella sp.]|nr:bacterioferritin [Sulfuricella sp.]
MKGDQGILPLLNKLLAGELTAHDQYFIHSEMYRNWGLSRLHDRVRHEMDDEREHARQLIVRILFLEGTPDLASRAPLTVGANVPQMLENDLALEMGVVNALRAVIAQCETQQDYVTRELLEQMLDDTEEDHAHWLEQQLGLIKLVSLENYIQSQMGSGSPS